MLSTKTFRSLLSHKRGFTYQERLPIVVALKLLNESLDECSPQRKKLIECYGEHLIETIRELNKENENNP